MERNEAGRQKGVATMGSIGEEAREALEVQPDDYYIMWQEIIVNALREGRDGKEIEAVLLDHYPNERAQDLWTVILRTKSRWERYLRFFQATGKAGRPRALDTEGVMVLVTLMKTSPRMCGYAEENWTVANLIDSLHRWGGITVSDSTVRRVLRKLGYRWHENRYQRDPAVATTGVATFDKGIDITSVNVAACHDAAILRSTIARINEIPPGVEPKNEGQLGSGPAAERLAE